MSARVPHAGRQTPATLAVTDLAAPLLPLGELGGVDRLAVLALLHPEGAGEDGLAGGKNLNFLLAVGLEAVHGAVVGQGGVDGQLVAAGGFEVGSERAASRAGMPTAVAPGGTSVRTTLIAPILAPRPMRTGPRIWA